MPPPPTTTAVATTGVLVDCGSGHTSVTQYECAAAGDPGSTLLQRGKTWLKHSSDGGNLPLTDVIPGSPGGSFVGETLSERVAEFIGCLQEALLRLAVGDIDILLLGGTGGVRAAVEEGRLAEHEVESIREAVVAAFADVVRVVKFVVVSGGEEACWEHQAAQVIWGGQSEAMFPNRGEPVTATATPAAAGERTGVDIGLFSGGGKSMQLGRSGSALSFPFSTFPAELEERQGASADAWLVPEKWARFTDELAAKVADEAARHPKFAGCFVGTAMNHRAARYTEFSERPISAGAATAALQASLPQFTQRKGELYDRMMANSSGSSYPLARITAMHTFRLATVLELMFDPEAQLFFAKDGTDAAGNAIDCEWTVGAFVEEARSLSSTPP